MIISVVAFGIAALIGPAIIPVLRRLKFGQEIREIGPSWHKKKSGTPTMGGFIFIISVILVTLIFVRQRVTLFVLLFSLIFGLIGFVDDFIKVILKRNLGLTEKQKSLMQILAALAFVFASIIFDITDTSVIVPFVDEPLVLPLYIYIPFVLFVIVGCTNSVNLTDGVDGLASAVTVVVCLFFTKVAFDMGRMDIAAFALINAAALIGFLLYNRHPARVFMGDTGSLYLGGVVCFCAMALRLPLILIVAGGIYVLETLSVILQVASFKLTGKRIFKMSPIHHHFEMCGWSERRIVLTAIFVTMILCAVSYLIIM
ncbi:MAG: phospho-N-acetylmuramoyl-pentapeptide-transferase [Clostridia bacterium]|nr:phospho-N-acetylmuramoyl-pentapeptide-transferase [Clostridia bacterium]